LKSAEEMTQLWHHPPLIVELLAHQLHFQSTFKNGGKIAEMQPRFGAWPLWPAAWVGYELGGSAPHQCR